jgi:methionyl aminopeptidase
VIERQFGTLPWCKRYLDRIGQKNYTVAVRSRPLSHREETRITLTGIVLQLNELVNKGIVQDYPPLVDMAKDGCQTAQFVRCRFSRLYPLVLERC